ncbi:TolC family protein [Pedobacter sp. CAN_A7]|uniref:TolC family protein n=1 Tax=Pedobacter sp. CAN_A7 TaxID=2787722 RepID=UPI002FEF188B
MKLTLLNAIFLLLLPIIIKAQESPVTLRLSLREARKMALHQNPRLRAGDLNTQIARENIAQVKWKRIPQVYADFNLQRNLIIPVTPVPANAFNPSAPEGELLPLRFSTKWTANTGLNAQVDLFNPQKKQELQEAKLQAEQSVTEQQQLENDIDFEVSKAYAAALIAEEQLRLAIADTVAKFKMVTMTQEQFDAGRLLLAELNLAKADRNTTLSHFDEATKINADATAQLLYHLGYDPEAEVKLEFTDDIESLFSSFQGVAMADSSQRLSLKRLDQEEQMINVQLKGTKNGFLPVLAVQGYYGSNYFDNNFELFKSRNWNGNSFVNVGLRIPLTEGLERVKKISQLKLQQQVNRLEYQDQQHKNKLDGLAASREVALAEKKYTRAKDNFILAQENYQNVQAQYNNGRLLIGDFYKQSYAYEQEKNSYLNASYDFILARMKQEKTLKD